MISTHQAPYIRNRRPCSTLAMRSLTTVTFCFLALSTGVYGFRATVNPHPEFPALKAASPESSISLTFALASMNMDGLHTALLDVSDPASSNYGKHLTKAQVSASHCCRTQMRNLPRVWV